MKRWATEHWWVGVCAGLLAVYAGMAWSAARGKSATYDEPLSVVSAWGAGRLGDYRVDYEHPPLWKRWAWVGNWGAEVKADLTSADWAGIGERPMGKWKFAHEVMYKSGNDWRGMVMRARGMMLIVAVTGGALVAWWGWKLGGGVAAVVGTGLYAFDPGFLGHGPLVKNDVANAVVTTGIFYMTWLVGRRVTLPRAAALAALCGAALVVKLSAVVVGPIVAAMLLGRAVLGGEWRVGKFPVGEQGVRARVGVALGICAVAVGVSVGVVWGAYGFRYGVSPDARYRLDMGHIVAMQAAREFSGKNPLYRPTERELAAWDPGVVSRLAMKMNEWRLMPEPWLAGVLFTQRTAIGDKGYLNGGFYWGGKWYYFLEAMLVKTPVGTVAGVGMAVAWGFLSRRRKSEDTSQKGEPPPAAASLGGWDLACLAVPAALLIVGSCFASLNLGLRYMLPVYPLLFVLAGVAASGVWRMRVGRVAVVLLGVTVAAESLRAWPDYIAFFNTPSGGSRGGLHLMGDSNLDWGQDLPLVKEWQDRHPGEELFLSYFGMEDPAAWGIQYRNLPAGFAFADTMNEWPTGDAWLMVSATNLQGIYLRQDLFRTFREMEPAEVLGGTIYVYRVKLD